MHQVINEKPKKLRKFIAEFFNCCRTRLLVPMVGQPF